MVKALPIGTLVLQYNCTLVKSESGSESKRYKEILREGFKKKNLGIKFV